MSSVFKGIQGIAKGAKGGNSQSPLPPWPRAERKREEYQGYKEMLNIDEIHKPIKEYQSM
jgi:hypothetical protein